MNENRGMCLLSPSFFTLQCHSDRKGNTLKGNFEKFSTCLSRLGFQHFDLFIYVFLRLFFFSLSLLQRTFTKKDGNTIKGIEMSTLAFERLFLGGAAGAGVGWEEGAFGGAVKKTS